MTLYETLLEEAYQEGVTVKEVSLNSNAAGLYMDNKIAINKKVSTASEKTCILAEELGHHYSSYGNIIDCSKVENVKQERLARKIAYEKLIDLNAIADLVINDNLNKFEIIEKLNITEEFFNEAIEYYSQKYGVCREFENYSIVFYPYLSILKRV